MTVRYNNLSQSVGDRVVYLRSTNVETMNYHKLLWSIPDEWFYQLHIGNSIELYEVTTKKTGGKICRIFIPVLIDILNYLWYNTPPKHKKYLAHFNCGLEAIHKDKSLYSKYMYWKGLINVVNITSTFKVVDKEPNLIKRK